MCSIGPRATVLNHSSFATVLAIPCYYSAQDCSVSLQNNWAEPWACREAHSLVGEGRGREVAHSSVVGACGSVGGWTIGPLVHHLDPRSNKSTEPNTPNLRDLLVWLGHMHPHELDLVPRTREPPHSSIELMFLGLSYESPPLSHFVKWLSTPMHTTQLFCKMIEWPPVL
jgi:hypothetical protein